MMVTGNRSAGDADRSGRPVRAESERAVDQPHLRGDVAWDCTAQRVVDEAYSERRGEIVTGRQQA